MKKYERGKDWIPPVPKDDPVIEEKPDCKPRRKGIYTASATDSPGFNSTKRKPAYKEAKAFTQWARLKYGISVPEFKQLAPGRKSELLREFKDDTGTEFIHSRRNQ